METQDKSTLSKEELEKLELVKRAPTEEILTEELLTKYITEKRKLVHYIGFEISGLVHLGGLIGMAKVADFQKAGADTTVFLADLHTWINKKLGGDIDTIRHVAKSYFGEALKMSIKCIGGSIEQTKFVLGSELYERMGERYFENVLKVASTMTLARTRRSITILGRKQGDSISLSQLIYVPMQVADIYSLNVNLAHAGLDQRKAHVVAIESSTAFDYKPVAVHHHLLMGMQLTEEQRNLLLKARSENNREALEDEYLDIKMSKSKPQSAIFIHDTEEEIKSKINGAYCPIGSLEFNPVTDLVHYVIWPYLSNKGEILEIQNKKTGETMAFKTLDEFDKAYTSTKIHPMDLKEAVEKYIIELLEPARSYFLEGNGKKYLEEMKDVVITR